MNSSYCISLLLLAAFLTAAPPGPDLPGTKEPAPPLATSMQPGGLAYCIGETGPFVVVGYLYWKSQYTDSLITTESKSVQDGNIILSQERKSAPFEYNSGLTLGIGVNLIDQAWTPYLNWTYLHSHPRKTWHSDTGDLTNSLAHPLLDNIIAPVTLGHLHTNDVSAEWTFTFNCLDAEIGKTFQVAEHVLQRTFGCIRVINVSTKLNVKYANQKGDQDVYGILDQIDWPDQTVNLENAIWAVGPRIGLNNSFGLFGGFGFLANLASSILAVFDSPKYKADAVAPIGSSAPPSLLPSAPLPAVPTASLNPQDQIPVGSSTKAPQIQFRPCVECHLGLSWSHCFPKKAVISLIGGFSVQHYTQLISPVASLNLFGWTFTAISAF